MDYPTDIPDNLPTGSDVVFLTPEFVNQILNVLREGRISMESDDSPLQIREVGPGGTVLGLDTADCP